jgi:hypothetical protein
MTQSIVFSNGCIKTTVQKCLDVNIDSLVGSNSPLYTRILVYNNHELYPYTHINGKCKNGIIYYVSNPEGKPEVSYVIVSKRCINRDTFAKSSVHPPGCDNLVINNIILGDTIIMNFHMSPLTCNSFNGRNADSLRLNVLKASVNILRCYDKYTINLKLSHLYMIKGEIKMGDADCSKDGSSDDTFPALSPLWPIMVIIINTYIYPDILHKNNSPSKDNALQLISDIKPKYSKKYLDLAKMILYNDINSLDQLSHIIEKM